MCKCFCFSAAATSTLQCLMFPHQPPRDVFGPSVKFQDAKTEKINHLPNHRFLIKISLKNDDFGSSERLPPLSAVPPTNKKTHPPISKPHPAKKSFFPPFFSHAQVLCFSAIATSTLHCLMFPHQPRKDVFGPSVKFQDAKTEKKHNLPNDRFLIRILLENDDFGSSERLPPLSAVPPTNKKTHPPISKPHPAKKSFFPPCFSHVQVLCFSATATSTLHCLMFPHQPPRDVFGPSVKFQDAKTEKINHLPNHRFLIKISLKNDDFGSSERLPPLSAVPPTNKKTHPPISKPHPATKIFFHHSFLMCKCFCFSATATSTLQCLMFPHQPRKDVFGPSVKFQDAKTEKINHLPNHRFLIKISLKNDDFGSSERLPPLSGVPPTNKKTHPPISKPHPAKTSFFFHRAFLMCKCFFFCKSFCCKCGNAGTRIAS